ncbi:unnamed protein product, partial [Scytosiphon promiscuus]
RSCLPFCLPIFLSNPTIDCASHITTGKGESDGSLLSTILLYQFTTFILDTTFYLSTATYYLTQSSESTSIMLLNNAGRNPAHSRRHIAGTKALSPRPRIPR